MKLLALETVDISASAAILEDAEVIREISLPPEKKSAQFLTPMISELLNDAGWTPADVELVALPIGPGSFTGLRVGVTFAKTFAYITGSAVIGLNTLDILAAAVPECFPYVSAVMDAQRNQVIARKYTGKTPCDEMRLLDFDAWAATLDAQTAVTGPILKRYGKLLPAEIPQVPEEFWRISPAFIGKMAYEMFLASRRDSVWDMLPIYARQSAAEERLMEARRK